MLSKFSRSFYKGNKLTGHWVHSSLYHFLWIISMGFRTFPSYSVIIRGRFVVFSEVYFNCKVALYMNTTYRAGTSAVLRYVPKHKRPEHPVSLQGRAQIQGWSKQVGNECLTNVMTDPKVTCSSGNQSSRHGRAWRAFGMPLVFLLTRRFPH